MNNTNTISKSSLSNVRTMTGILSFISFVLAMIEFPVPFSPSFARMDLSDFSSFIGALVYGPFVGVGIELIKNALHVLSTSTAGIGELANFIISTSFVASALMIYQLGQSPKMATIACLVGSLVMASVATVVNYYLLLPLFEGFMPLDQLFASFKEWIPFIHSKWDIVTYNVFPFNLLKGMIMSFVTMILY